jgi:hypothetical protein
LEPKPQALHVSADKTNLIGWLRIPRLFHHSMRFVFNNLKIGHRAWCHRSLSAKAQFSRRTKREGDDLLKGQKAFFFESVGRLAHLLAGRPVRCGRTHTSVISSYASWFHRADAHRSPTQWAGHGVPCARRAAFRGRERVLQGNGWRLRRLQHARIAFVLRYCDSTSQRCTTFRVGLSARSERRRRSI